MKRIKIPIWIIAFIIIIAISITAITYSFKENKTTEQDDTVSLSAAIVKEVVGIGKVEPENKILNLAASSAGIISVIIKTDGDSVEAGEKLVQLEDHIERLKVNEIKSQMNTQRSQIEIERSSLKDAEWKIENKRKLLITTQNLVDKGAETQQVYDDLETEVKTLEVSMEKARSNIQLAQNKLNEIVEQLRTAEAEADEKTLLAPTAGKILNMQVTQGASLNQYATYAEFAPKGPHIVRAEVDELFSQKLQVGQQVDILYAGSNEVIATGEITTLSPYLKKKSLFSEKANDQEDRRVREIRINIKDKPDLVINSKVECVIKL